MERGAGLGLAREAVPGQELPLSMAARIAHLTLWVCEGQINVALVERLLKSLLKHKVDSRRWLRW